MSSTGTSTFSTTGRTVTTFKREVWPAGKYDGTLRTGTLEIRGTKNAPGKPVRVCGAYVEIRAKDGSEKTLRVYNDFFTSLYPSPRDGVVMPDRGGQLTQLSEALGSKLEEAPLLETTYTGEGGEEITCQYIDPNSLKDFLANFDGTDIRVEIKTEKRQGSDDKENKVANFLPATEA